MGGEGLPQIFHAGALLPLSLGFVDTGNLCLPYSLLVALTVKLPED